MLSRLSSAFNSFALMVILFLTSCDWGNNAIPSDEIHQGYRPVYGTLQQKEITLKSSQTIKNPGKIYVYGNYLLVNEKQKGIHIIDNSNPEQPQFAGFIEILGNSDMAIKDDVLYADHLGNLVALRHPGFNSIELMGILPLKNWHLGLPPPASSYFECVEQEKGFVVAWQKVMLKNPECYALN